MKLSNQIFLFALGLIALGAGGCGVLPSNSAEATRAATQTPFIIYVPVTTTPEPATLTPLATVTSATLGTPTRTATRPVAQRPTATRTKPAAPVAAGPSSTPAPACAYSPPLLLEPDERAEVKTLELRPGTGAFIFKWTPPPGIGGDDIGYKIQMDARSATGKPVNSDTVYISHTKFVSDSQGQKLIYDSQRVWGMKQGDENSTVYWYVKVVKFTGTIDDLGRLSGTAVDCAGSQSETRKINIIVL